MICLVFPISLANHASNLFGSAQRLALQSEALLLFLVQLLLGEVEGHPFPELARRHARQHFINVGLTQLPRQLQGEEAARLGTEFFASVSISRSSVALIR
jgi:hypothetical protein